MASGGTDCGLPTAFGFTAVLGIVVTPAAEWLVPVPGTVAVAGRFGTGAIGTAFGRTMLG